MSPIFDENDSIHTKSFHFKWWVNYSCFHFLSWPLTHQAGVSYKYFMGFESSGSQRVPREVIQSTFYNFWLFFAWIYGQRSFFSTCRTISIDFFSSWNPISFSLIWFTPMQQGASLFLAWLVKWKNIMIGTKMWVRKSPEEDFFCRGGTLLFGLFFLSFCLSFPST